MDTTKKTDPNADPSHALRDPSRPNTVIPGTIPERRSIAEISADLTTALDWQKKLPVLREELFIATGGVHRGPRKK